MNALNAYEIALLIKQALISADPRIQKVFEGLEMNPSGVVIRAIIDNKAIEILVKEVSK